jgi:hypothetical protein
MGRGVCLPKLRLAALVGGASGPGLPRVRWLRETGVGDRGHGVRRHSLASQPMVRGSLAGVLDQERGFRARPANSARAGQL